MDKNERHSHIKSSESDEQKKKNSLAYKAPMLIKLVFCSYPSVVLGLLLPFYNWTACIGKLNGYAGEQLEMKLNRWENFIFHGFPCFLIDQLRS